MSALIRITIAVAAAAFAIVLAVVLFKIVLALASIALVVLACVFTYHFARAIYRRLTARREPVMLASGPPTIL